MIEARKFEYSTSRIEVNQGDTVILRLRPRDVSHGLYLDGYGLETEAAPAVPGVPGGEGVLTSRAEKMASGDLETPISSNRTDEVGTLANTFESMRVKLKESLEEIEKRDRELEQRVQERTHEVQQLYEELQRKEELRGPPPREGDLRSGGRAQADRSGATRRDRPSPDGHRHGPGGRRRTPSIRTLKRPASACNGRSLWQARASRRSASWWWT